MADKTKLGEGYYKISADASEFDAATDKAEQSAEDLASTTEEASARASAAIGGVGDAATSTANKVDGATKKSGRGFSKMAENVQASVSKQVGILTGLVGAFVAVVGAGKIFIEIGKKIGETLFNSGKKITTAREDIDKLSESLGIAAEQAAIYDRVASRGLSSGLLGDLEKVNEKIAKQEQLIASGAAFSETAAERRLDQLRGERAAITDVLNEQERLTRAIERRDARQAELFAADEQRSAKIMAMLASEAATIKTLEAAGIDRAEAVRRATEEEIAAIDALRDGATQKQLQDIETLKAARMDRSRLEIQLIRDEEEARARAGQQQRDDAEADLAERLREEAERMRREELEPVQRRILELEDRSSELLAQLAEASSPELRAELLRLMAEVVQKVDRLREESKEQMKQQPSEIGREVEQAIDSVLARYSVDAIFDQLAVIASNTEGD